MPEAERRRQDRNKEMARDQEKKVPFVATPATYLVVAYFKANFMEI